MAHMAFRSAKENNGSNKQRLSKKNTREAAGEVVRTGVCTKKTCIACLSSKGSGVAAGSALSSPSETVLEGDLGESKRESKRTVRVRRSSSKVLAEVRLRCV